MATNVEPHEAEAIRELLDGDSGKRAGEVLDRDFRNPRRLGSEDFVEFKRQFHLELPDLEVQLGESLESTCPIELGSIGEINSRDLFSDSEGPFAAIVFEVLGQPAWVVWESVAAINAVEKILGSTPDSTKARLLTNVEVSVLEGLMSIVADTALRSLKLEGSNLRVAQSLESLGSWRDASGEADPHRLHIELPFQGPREASCFHVYIPAPRGAEVAQSPKSGPVDLPQHLDEVRVDLCLTLGSCEVMLHQLLDLEVGDVIPLDTRVSDLACLQVEGIPHAKGTLGRRNKQVALRIEQLVNDPSKIQ